jgi:hypothetical protein
MSVNWAEMGLTPPLTEPHTITIMTDDDQATTSVGPCIEPPPPPEPGSVTAHKFYDANENGVQDEGEEDIEGWLFRLYFLDGDGIHFVVEGSTGFDGTVTFTGVPPGLYKVWEALPECWTPTTPPGRHWNGGYYTTVDLGEGQHVAFEFGNIEGCAPPPKPPPPEPNPSIDIEKYVSVDDQGTWHDADTPPGPGVSAGSETVWFRFVVTNDGDVPLTNVTLSDSDFGAAIADQCAVPYIFAPGESFECVIGPFVAVVGQHVNTATVTGDYGKGTCGDTDRAKYFGTEACADADGDGVCDEEDNTKRTTASTHPTPARKTATGTVWVMLATAARSTRTRRSRASVAVAHRTPTPMATAWPTATTCAPTTQTRPILASVAVAHRTPTLMATA